MVPTADACAITSSNRHLGGPRQRDDACPLARLWRAVERIDDVTSVADINRDDAPGRPDRAGRGRRFLRIDPPEPVPLLTMPRAFAVVTAGAALAAALVELLRRAILGWA